ncbi:MAG: FAD binding domain-containing protein [Acidimicrobiales bacterium]
MKPATFTYRRAGSVEEALALLAEHGDEAKLLSGGQSLVPLLNMRLAQPSVVVDIARIPELATASERPGHVRYGAGTVHARFEDALVPDPTRGLLHAVAGGIGYRAIRNRGTLGGSLAHADSSAEWPVVMAALGADVVVQSARAGERTMPAAGFVQGFFTSVLDDDEAIVAVDVPRLPAGARWGFAKAARKPGEFAESLAVAVVTVDEDGLIRGAELWLGAATPVPLRVASADEVLRGRAWDDEARSEVQVVSGTLLAAEDHRPDTDPDARYEHHLHGVTAVRAIDRALQPSEGPMS